MEALGTKCWLCPETARPKAKWASVLDERVAESICKLLWLDTRTYIECFTSADYCGSCQEFVLQIDLLIRTMRNIKTKILVFRAKISQAVIHNMELSATIGEISPRYEDDDDPGFPPEYQDVPSQTSPSDTTAGPQADSPTGVCVSPAFEQKPVVKLELNSFESLPNVYQSVPGEQSLLAKTSSKINSIQAIPELAEPSPDPPEAAETQPDASVAVIQKMELSATIGEISPRYVYDDNPVFPPENQDVPPHTSPSDTTAGPQADSPTGVCVSPAFEQKPVVLKLESNSVALPKMYQSGSEVQSLLAIYLAKTSPKMNSNQAIAVPELAEPSNDPPKAAETQPDADVSLQTSTIAVSVRRQTRSLTSAIQKPIISYRDDNNSGTESDSVCGSSNGDSEFVANFSDSESNDDKAEAEPACQEDSLQTVNVFSQQNHSTELSLNTTTTGASTSTAKVISRLNLNTESGTNVTKTPGFRTSSRKRKATRESRYHSESDISSQDDLSSESDSSSKTSKRQKTARNKRKARKNESRRPVNKRVSLTVEQRTAKADGRFHCFHGNCPKNYLRVRELIKHIYLWHTERTPEEDESMMRFPCREPECSFFSRSGFALEVHMHKVHKNDPRPYKCIPCKKDYGTHNRLIVHNNRNHREKEFACYLCGHQYSRKSELDFHMLKKHKDTEGLKCKVCHQKFFLKEDCDKHEEKHAPGGPLSLTCLVMACKKVFENQEVLRQHVVESHYGAKRFICEHCGATLSSAFLLRNHFKTHSGVFEFPCTDCEKRFRSKALLQSHFETVHAVDKTIYPCKRCDKTFHCKSYLYKHNAWHKHGDNANKPLAKQKKIA